ncbi:hypothetical protein ABPG72_007779 [Tetrahymena utriculariae]
MIKFSDPTNIRQIIVCSTISERPVLIENYRAFEKTGIQGIQQYEVKFLRLVERISSGAKFQISKNGTAIKYYPGIITNNEGIDFEFDCGEERCITYFLEPLTILALFGKSKLSVKLKGVTNDEIDMSVDTFSNCTLHLIRKFQIEGELFLKVNKRGFKPNGQGEVIFKVPFVKFLRSIKLKQQGKIKRIRGVCSGARVNPSILNRIITSARGIFNDFLPDVYIYSDFYKGGNKEGSSAGYSISLIAEYNNGQLVSIDECLDESHPPNYNLPEAVGERAALALLDEILYTGFADSSNQSIVLTLMALSERKISSVRLGRITPYTVENLKIIQQFLGITFKIEADEEAEDDEEQDQNQQKMQEEEDDDSENVGNKKESGVEDESLEPEIDLDEQLDSVTKPTTVIFSCLGSGLQNISRIVK